MIDQWEQIIQETAWTLEYPPTPDIAGRVRERLATKRRTNSRQLAVSSRQRALNRRLAWGVALVLVLLVGSLLSVPELRAALLRVLQVGPIRVFVDETLPTATFAPTVSAPATATAAATENAATVVNPSPMPTDLPSPSPHSLATAALSEPLTLAEAQEQVTFPIALPDYSEELGAPGAAYLHPSGRVTAVTLVWFQPKEPEQIWFSLTQIPVSEFEFALKWALAEDVVEFFLNGQRALWIKGPHQIQLIRPESVSPVMIASNVLIWTADDVTYRIEGNIAMDEAISIAKSLE